MDARAPAPTLRAAHGADRPGVRHAEAEVRGVRAPMLAMFQNTFNELTRALCAATIAFWLFAVIPARSAEGPAKDKPGAPSQNPAAGPAAFHVGAAAAAFEAEDEM